MRSSDAADISFSIVNLSVEYRLPGVPPRAALRAVTINELEPGRPVLLCGRNGAGKTTLLRTLIGSLHPNTGHLVLHQNGLATSTVVVADHLRTVFVPQQPHEGLVPDFTIAEALLQRKLAWDGPRLTLRKWPSRQELDELASNLSSLRQDGRDIFSSEDLSRSVRSLSAGQAQMVNVASAILGGAQVVLLDEPTTYLDPKHEDITWGLIDLAARTAVVLLTSHDLDTARSHVHREVEISNGQVTYDGSPRSNQPENSTRSVMQ